MIDLQQLISRALGGEMVVVTLAELSSFDGGDGGLRGLLPILTRLSDAGVTVKPGLELDDMQLARRLVVTRPGLTGVSTASYCREALAAGEGERVEFKSTFLRAVGKEIPEEEVKYQVVKALAGMLNHRGGCILVGVADDGQVVGIEQDFDSRRPNTDVWLRGLVDVFQTRLKPLVVSDTLLVDTPTIEGRTICCIRVRAEGPGLTYARDTKNAWHVYTRVGSMTKDVPIDEVEGLVLRRQAQWSRARH